MVLNLSSFMDKLATASTKKQAWPIVHNLDHFESRLKEITNFLVSFTENGGPSFSASQQPLDDQKNYRPLSQLEKEVIKLSNVGSDILEGQ